MKSFALFSMLAVAVTVQATEPYNYVRLDKNDAVLLVVDHQIGLNQLVRDYLPAVFRQAVTAHAAIGKVFNLPTILTTSAEGGPNGKLPKDITDMHPNATYIRRNGEVNAWDNPDFKAAVKATGKKQVILAGITTDVCTTFLALSLRAEGYEVFANTDASGTFSDKIAADANRRMEKAGVHLLSAFAVVLELMRDWRHTPGAPELLPYFDRYLVEYSNVARAHRDSVLNGTLLPGEETADIVAVPGN